MSSTFVPPRTPSPASQEEEAGAKVDGASEIELSHEIEGLVKDLEAEAGFFTTHLNPCPERLVNALNKKTTIKESLRTIMKATAADREQKLYQPACTLLTTISKDIFAYLKREGRVHLPEREIVFLDHHRCHLTHFPMERLEDKPDIVGVINRTRGFPRNGGNKTYSNIPYHRVETVVEAKSMDGGDGRAQATRYAYKIQQARPDRPGLYVLSIKPQHFQVVFSSPVGPVASEHTLWTDLRSLCAYVYSLYDPPSGHTLYDRTITWSEQTDLSAPKWTVQTASGCYADARVTFLGDPWARRTTVLRVVRDDQPIVVIKEAFVDCKRRFKEAELLEHVHKDGYLHGVVLHISSEIVQADGGDITFTRDDGTMTRVKYRIVFADTGYDLTLAKSVNDLLKTVYDALEVHRTLASARKVLHRDMSLFNILMYPQWGNRVGRRCMEHSPALIDDVLSGQLRPPEDRKARCVVIDLDNSAQLTTGQANAIDQKELQSRTGTPAYIARAVSNGTPCCNPVTISNEKMPLLEGAAKALYIQVYGEERYNKYNDSANTIHGGIPLSPTLSQRELLQRAEDMIFYHRWEYDAESALWTMYSALLRVTPVDFEETAAVRASLSDTWRSFRDHRIPAVRTTTSDPRNSLIERTIRGFRAPFPPVMEPVADLLLDLCMQAFPSYAMMEQLPPLDDHLHEAMQRLILSYLVKHQDNPIPLVSGKRRAVNFPEPPKPVRGTHGGTTEELQCTEERERKQQQERLLAETQAKQTGSGSRGQKRPREPTAGVDGPGSKLRRSLRNRKK
ncbi:hypothetical protein C8Q70DRAFT_934829 [Cubamyces menziesii]|nr:hypothetical protein C8Q70DRAFT_934829 [Cubamyces menziesii]